MLARIKLGAWQSLDCIFIRAAASVQRVTRLVDATIINSYNCILAMIANSSFNRIPLLAEWTENSLESHIIGCKYSLSGPARINCWMIEEKAMAPASTATSL